MDELPPPPAGQPPPSIEFPSPPAPSSERPGNRGWWQRRSLRARTAIIAGASFALVVLIINAINPFAFPSPGVSAVTAADSENHACALVRYWADTTGTLPDPDSGATTKEEVVSLAKHAWPRDMATEDAFVLLYDDLFSNEPDAEYTNEARTFESANC